MKIDISIIGGAGPQAGSLLFDQIIETCQKKYNCSRDYHFPSIELLSFPFTEMLIHESPQIEKELTEVLQCARGTQIVVACNTLHFYIKYRPSGFVHMLEEGTKFIMQPPLVFSSKISNQKKLHQRFFPCIYPTNEEQTILEVVIDLILENGPTKNIKNQLLPILRKYRNIPVLLGCTEFSVLHRYCSLGKNMLDLSQILADKLCSNYFNSLPTTNSSS